MEILILFFVLFFGLVVGSFLNCVIYRLEEGKSFLRGRSFCPDCKHNLAWNDLIPVLSFVFLGGKCRYCRRKISWQYPLVEIATGLLLVSLIWEFGLSLDFLSWILISGFLAVIFVYDFKHYIIPDRVVFPAIAVAGAYDLLRFGMPGEKLGFLLSALGAAGFFLAIVLVSRGKWMGVGDIKLAFLMGLLLGWPNILVALYLAFLMGAVVGVGLVVSEKKGLKSELPFGPFLIIGTYLALFFGRGLFDWYLNLVLLK